MTLYFKLLNYHEELTQDDWRSLEYGCKEFKETDLRCLNTRIIPISRRVAGLVVYFEFVNKGLNWTNF